MKTFAYFRILSLVLSFPFRVAPASLYHAYE